MNRDALQIAVAEAKRFLKRAEELPEMDDNQWSFPREQGAIKRASMDLTRALADVRRPER